MERRDKIKKAFGDKELKKVKISTKKTAAIVLSVFSVLSCVLAVLGFLYIRTAFSDPAVVRRLVGENYILGAIAMILICALQVIVALVPGELVEIASGYIFGAWEGAFICLAGIMLGSVIVILLTRKIGRRFIEALCPREKLESLPILNDSKKRNAFTAVLFLIPGTPKDIFTYIIALTEMSIPAYVLITAVARFPSIIMSTLGGDALIDKDLTRAIWIFIVTGVISLCGYLLYQLIKMGRSSKSKEKDTNKNKKK